MASNRQEKRTHSSGVVVHTVDIELDGLRGRMLCRRGRYGTRRTELEKWFEFEWQC